MVVHVLSHGDMQGFGYITPADGSKDVFVHQSAIYAPGFRSLKDGEGVEYTIETDEQGRVKAANVTGSSNGFVQGAPRRPFRYGRRGGRGGSEGMSLTRFAIAGAAVFDEVFVGE